VQPSRLPLSRLQPSSRLPPFLFAQPIVQPSRRPERKSIPGQTPRGETRYRVHTCTVFINPSSSPFQIRCDPTRLLQIGDRTEIVSTSATSRWISPYKLELYPASLHPDPSRHSRPSLHCRPAESRPQKSICRLKEAPPRRHHRRDRRQSRSYTRSCPHHLQEPAEPPFDRQLSVVHLRRGKWSKRIPPIV
jgi:hypothetical protein